DTLETGADFYDSGNLVSPLPVTSTWSAGDTVLTCRPVGSFPANHSIIWFVSGQNPNGDFLTGELNGFFITGGSGGTGGSGTNRITSFALGKVAVYEQLSTAAPTLDPDASYNFSASTFLASNRTATAIKLTLPNSAVSNLNQFFLQPEEYF